MATEAHVDCRLAVQEQTRYSSISTTSTSEPPAHRGRLPIAMATVAITLFLVLALLPNSPIKATFAASNLGSFATTTTARAFTGRGVRADVKPFLAHLAVHTMAPEANPSTPWRDLHTYTNSAFKSGSAGLQVGSHDGLHSGDGVTDPATGFHRATLFQSNATFYGLGLMAILSSIIAVATFGKRLSQQPLLAMMAIDGEDSELAQPSKLEKVRSFLVSTALSVALVFSPSSAEALTASERNLTTLFSNATQSVAFVENLEQTRDVLTPRVTEKPKGTGSGIVWDTQRGIIVTNAHVIDGSDEVAVTLQIPAKDSKSKDKTVTYGAKVLGVDGDKDIAVLELCTSVPSRLFRGPERVEEPIDYSKLKAIKRGTSANLLVGQDVNVIGNPFGLNHSLSRGVLSAVDREIPSGINGRPIQGVLQIDAPVNPGNSGGPVLDSDGNLIGMATSIISSSGTSAGVGFAIPVDAMESSVEEIIETGRVLRPILGITLVPDEATRSLGLEGALVLDLLPDGPAGKSGIAGSSRDDYGRIFLGDLVVAVDGNEVKSNNDLFRELDKCSVGQEVELTISKDRGQNKVNVRLGGRITSGK